MSKQVIPGIKVRAQNALQSFGRGLRKIANERATRINAKGKKFYKETGSYPG